MDDPKPSKDAPNRTNTDNVQHISGEYPMTLYHTKCYTLIAFEVETAM